MNTTMKLYFVNVECEVRIETRMLPAKQAEANRYRTFTYVVIAASEREAIAAAPDTGDNWYEIKRYTQNPDGNEPGEAIFFGCTDHDRKLYTGRMGA